MALHPQNIGAAMPHGFAGNYAITPDAIVNPRPAGGDEQIIFGAALKYDGNGAVIPMGDGDTAEAFVGVAAQEVKTAVNYQNQGVGIYVPGDAVPVFMRGAINVKCNVGTPKLGGGVYIRVAANAAIPTGVVGGFEAAADGANTVELTNCRWAGLADANGIAALRILTMNNA